MAWFWRCWLIIGGGCILWWLFVWCVVKRHRLLPSALCGVLVQRAVPHLGGGFSETMPAPVEHVLAGIFFATPAPIIPDGKPSAVGDFMQRHAHAHPLIMAAIWV